MTYTIVSLWGTLCCDHSPLVHAVVQIIGIASTSNNLHHCKAQQGDNIEEEGCSLPPRPYKPTNDFMILSNMIPAEITTKSLRLLHAKLLTNFALRFDASRHDAAA